MGYSFPASALNFFSCCFDDGPDGRDWFSERGLYSVVGTGKISPSHKANAFSYSQRSTAKPI